MISWRGDQPEEQGRTRGNLGKEARRAGGEVQESLTTTVLGCWLFPTRPLEILGENAFMIGGEDLRT